jgi:hypothetical protein
MLGYDVVPLPNEIARIETARKLSRYEIIRNIHARDVVEIEDPVVVLWELRAIKTSDGLVGAAPQSPMW